MVDLKNGQTALDPRLGRVELFDEESRRFGVMETIEATEPHSVLWDLDEWLDQLEEGACVSFSLGHELAAVPVSVKGLDYDLLIDWYHEIQHRDPWTGCYLGPDCPIEPGEKYEGTAVLAGAKVLKDKGYFPEYRWAFGWWEMAMALAHEGPVVIGINWYEGMFNTDRAGFIWPTGRLSGGHAICIVGQVILHNADGSIDMEKSYFILHNSWGPEWGVQGRCYVTFQAMDTLLSQRGECLVPMFRADPTAVEPPAPVEPEPAPEPPAPEPTPPAPEPEPEPAPPEPAPPEPEPEPAAPEPEPVPEPEPEPEDVQPAPVPPEPETQAKYLGSRRSKVFHVEGCVVVCFIKEKNLQRFTEIPTGRRGCSLCKPLDEGRGFQLRR